MTAFPLTTPRGAPAVIHARDGTSDLATAGSVFAGVAGSPLVDEYGLRGTHIRGTFLDIGAHIGTVTVAVLLDNPDATAVCVEPLPENVMQIEENLAANGLTERATVMQAAFGTASVAYGHGHSWYIGNIGGGSERVVAVPQVRLADLPKADAIKTDCEGGEWALLADRGIRRVPLIFGEYHLHGPDRIRKALGKTHDVTVTETGEGFGLFRAVRR